MVDSAVGKSKGIQIVKSIFYSVKSDLRGINLFHTNRGSEFKNFAVEGSTIDNTVAEAQYSVVKIEFVFKRRKLKHDVTVTSCF